MKLFDGQMYGNVRLLYFYDDPIPLPRIGWWIAIDPNNKQTKLKLFKGKPILYIESYQLVACQDMVHELSNGVISGKKQ